MWVGNPQNKRVIISSRAGGRGPPNPKHTENKQQHPLGPGLGQDARTCFTVAAYPMKQNCKTGIRVPTNKLPKHRTTHVHLGASDPCPYHHSPTPRGRLDKRPRICDSWFSNMAWLLWFWDSIRPCNCWDCVWIRDCKFDTCWVWCAL